MNDPLAQWICDVHSALQANATPQQGASWGPVRMRHRTTRPLWFAAMDHAWACPYAGTTAHLDVISAAFDDLPPEIAPPPLRRGDLGPRGEAPIAPGSATRLTWEEQAGQVVGWDPQSGCALLLRATPLNGYDLVSPMRWLVHWGVAAAGGVLLHAASVGRRERGEVRGALLLGEAGFGKSTTTLACLSRGWLTCGDDAVAVFPAAGRWSASAVYAAVKTKLAHPTATPPDLPDAGVESVTWDIAGTKRVHLLTSTDAQTLCEAMAIQALILLDPEADPQARCEAVTPARARTWASPSTLLSLPFDRQACLQRIGRLASEVPATRLPRRSTLARTVDDLAEIMAPPTISVVLPLYNGERHVEAAVRSILSQTLGRFQIIAVDDAGVEPTLARVEAMRGQIEAEGHRLDVVIQTQNSGVAAARNAGAALADGAYLAWLDQDDIWPAERTAVLLGALQASGAMVARGRMRFVDLAPAAVRPWVREHWFQGDHPGYVLGAVLCRLDVLRQIGPLDELMRAGGGDDVDWFMRLRHAQVPVAEVEAVTVVRHIHESNQSGRIGNDELLRAVAAHLQRNRRVP